MKRETRNAEWIVEFEKGKYTIKSRDGKKILEGLTLKELRSLKGILEVGVKRLG